MLRIISTVIALGFFSNIAAAQSPVCKGKAEDVCSATEVNGVKDLCTWIKPRTVMKDTGVSEIKGYCRVKLRTITADEATKLKTVAAQ